MARIFSPEYKLEVALPKLATPPIENCEPGEDVPTPSQPFELIVSAEMEEVASAVEAARYKLLLIARNDHKLFAALLSVRRSCGALDVPIVTPPKSGVVVPTPTYVPVSITEEFANVKLVPFHFAR